MNSKNSFTYVISSDDRTNTGANPAYYDIDFGGFSEPFDNYIVDVVSFGAAQGFPVGSNYYYFVAENLANNGYLNTKKLTNREAIIAILPLNAVQDSYIQSDGGNISFQIINSRAKKTVRFKFIKQDFTTLVNETDINVGAGVDTRLFLVLRLTQLNNFL